MNEPAFTEEQHDQSLLTIARALKDIHGLGVDPINAAHALVATGLDELAVLLCADHLAEHLASVAEEVAERRAGLSDDKSKQVRIVIETAMTALKAIGADHRNASQLLAVQGLCRLGDDLEGLATVKRFVDEAWEAYSTSEGETLQ